MPNTPLYGFTFAAPNDPADGAGNEQTFLTQVEAAVRGQLSFVTGTQPFASTTLANVTQLVLPVVANATYRWELYLRYATTGAGSMKIAWTVPAAATMTWIGRNLDSSVTGANSGISPYNDLTAATTLQLGENAGGTMVAVPTGLVITGATPGNLQLQAAQQTTNATPAQVLVSSHLRMWRIL